MLAHISSHLTEDTLYNKGNAAVDSYPQNSGILSCTLWFRVRWLDRLPWSPSEGSSQSQLCQLCDVPIAGGICVKPAANVWHHNPIKMHGCGNHLRDVGVTSLLYLITTWRVFFSLIYCCQHCSYFWILMLKDSSSESRHIQPEKIAGWVCMVGGAVPQEGRAGGGQVSLTCQHL